jgi:XTP/dITP diphosphohydrolase
MKNKNLIIASNNKHKIEELKTILSPLGFHIKSLKEMEIDIEIVEDGKTFEENALKKAKVISEITEGIVLADDSGLEVEILGGAPGIYSARYAGEHGNDHKNNEKLLKELKDIPLEKRRAKFCCAIAIVGPRGEEKVFTGIVEGIIGFKAIGSHGFGYDPLFFIPEKNKTFGELDEREKNQISHRAKALNQLKLFLQTTRN